MAAERLRDAEGDIWEAVDGTDKLRLVIAQGSYALGLVMARSSVEVQYGPLEPTGGANLVDFVRELRELCDRWATKLGV